MSDLKACPFCGRIPDIEDCGEHRWFIRCKCGIAQDKLFFQKCDAVRAWNKRKELRVKDTNVPITDTISRQAAIDALIQRREPINNGDGTCTITPLTNAVIREVLNELPSAEPEIIRCKNCKYQEKYFHEDRRRKDGGYYIYGCELAEEYSHVCLDDDFCSRAEGRDDV